MICSRVLQVIIHIFSLGVVGIIKVSLNPSRPVTIRPFPLHDNVGRIGKLLLDHGHRTRTGNWMVVG